MREEIDTVTQIDMPCAECSRFYYVARYILEHLTITLLKNEAYNRFVLNCSVLHIWSDLQPMLTVYCCRFHLRKEDFVVCAMISAI